MKKAALIIFAICAFTCIKGQSITPDVYATAGDYFVGTNASISWTIGECIIETAVGTNAILTQGFQQPSYTITSIFESKNLDFEITLFPNPSSDFINLKLDSKKVIELEIVLFDLTGKLLLNDNVRIGTGLYQLNLTNFSVGTYLLKIQSNNGELHKSYKIQKIY